MSFDRPMQSGSREIHDVSSLGITCADCGVAIKELPFMPNKRQDGTYGRIFCRDCNRKRRPMGGGGGGFRN